MSLGESKTAPELAFGGITLKVVPPLLRELLQVEDHAGTRRQTRMGWQVGLVVWFSWKNLL
jgi:hypothetical protein